MRQLNKSLNNTSCGKYVFLHLHPAYLQLSERHLWLCLCQLLQSGPAALRSACTEHRCWTERCLSRRLVCADKMGRLSESRTWETDQRCPINVITVTIMIMLSCLNFFLKFYRLLRETHRQQHPQHIRFCSYLWPSCSKYSLPQGSSK